MKWIKCSERMPENITEVIAYGKCLCGTCGDAIDVVCVKYRPGKGFLYGEFDCTFQASHWMPLPKPPED